jgi:hypothetical protein
MKNGIYPLLAALALVAACAGEKDPSPPETDFSAPLAKPGFVSCNRDGRVTTSRAVAVRGPAGQCFAMLECLTISFSDTIPGEGVVQSAIFYTKPIGSSDSEFKIHEHMIVGYPYRTHGFESSCSITKTSQGWSGTFAGDFLPMKAQTPYRLRSGTFTDIKE